MPCQEHLVHTLLVFVVDDDDVVRRSIVKRLIRLHCTVRDFESGEALLQAFEQEKEIPDLMLLDYKMEGMDGIETLKAVRARHPSVPAFILTAYAGGLDMRLIKQMGNCEVLLKTVDLTSLGQIVQGALAVKSLRRQECPECFRRPSEADEW
jgi:two-component system, NtrC family, response regulator AtoC